MQLDISTPEEYWHYNYGDEHDDKDIFDKFVQDMDIRYFLPVSFLWKLKDECVFAGFSNMLDHMCAFITRDNQYYLLLQPCKQVHPEDFFNKYCLRNQMAFWPHGFHHPDTYMIVFSDRFIKFMRAYCESGDFGDFGYEKHRDKIGRKIPVNLDYMMSLYENCDTLLPDCIRDKHFTFDF